MINEYRLKNKEARMKIKESSKINEE